MSTLKGQFLVDANGYSYYTSAAASSKKPAKAAAKAKDAPAAEKSNVDTSALEK